MSAASCLTFHNGVILIVLGYICEPVVIYVLAETCDT